MKKTILTIIAGACVLAAIGLLVAATRGESSEEAKADFCQSLEDLGTTVVSYADLNPATATVDELDSAADDIYDAYDEVLDDAEDWANAYDNELADAYDDLYWAIQFLPGDYTVAESLDSLSDELSAFPEAIDATFDGSGCTTA